MLRSQLFRREPQTHTHTPPDYSRRASGALYFWPRHGEGRVQVWKMNVQRARELHLVHSFFFSSLFLYTVYTLAIVVYVQRARFVEMNTLTRRDNIIKHVSRREIYLVVIKTSRIGHFLSYTCEKLKWAAIRVSVFFLASYIFRYYI